MAGIGEDLAKLRTRKRNTGKGKERPGTSNKRPRRDDHSKTSATPTETTKPDNEPKNTKLIRYTKADEERNRELTANIFAELNEDRAFKPQQKLQHTFKVGKEEEDMDNSDNEEETEEKPAWVDEDDEVLVSTKKANLPEKVVSGHEYQEKLRQKHKLQSIQSDEWAQVKKKGKKKEGEDTDDSDEEEDILYRSQPLTAPDTRLMPGIVKILFKPIKHKHQSAVRRVSIHPVQPIAMSIDGNTVKVYHLGEKNRRDAHGTHARHGRPGRVFFAGRISDFCLRRPTVALRFGSRIWKNFLFKKCLGEKRKTIF
eukprot:Phypoly_transcript_07441.p1 GENE.Phypoly_transcript_07441~~Phypoly_transcript_07441.p1  ORF type:complete len:312 (-),score=54.29 Phypoly_transcript_07441:664-1599(-)